MNRTDQPYFQATGISKSFGHVKALTDVNFDVRLGEVHALMGENGAGKSTLIKIMSGLQGADNGVLRIDGHDVAFASSRDATAAGIATVHQELLLFPDLTVTENIFSAHYPRTAWGMIDWARAAKEARALLDSLDASDLDETAKIATLSVAQRQRVEIAKALSANARILILDEPTAALTDADARRLMAVVKQLRAQNVGIVYVSHRMPEIFELADRVTVFRDGALVDTKPIVEVDEPLLVKMMVGRHIGHLYPVPKAVIGAKVLSAKGLSCEETGIRDISFHVRAGEILGIAGLVGSGRTELAWTLFGITPATAGTISLAGVDVRVGSPQQARNLGIAYVPEDRAQQGLIKSQSLRKNVSMASMEAVSRGGFMQSAQETRRAEISIRRLGIKAKGPAQPVGQLSGGNQQKVVIAKWLETKPKVLILDEPTRGIDIAAKAHIHGLMSELAAEGLAIILISSELPEVLGMSDNVLVMHAGEMVGIIPRSEATTETVGGAMTLGRRRARMM